MTEMTLHRMARPLGARAWTIGGLIAVFAAGLVVQRAIESNFALTLASSGLLLGILALAVAFLMHQCGLVVFGIAAFYGGAAYVFAIAISAFQFAPLPAALLALGVSVAYAAVLGALIVRTRPLAFMMLTLAVGEMLRHMTTIALFRPLTGGADGIIVAFDGSILGLTAADFADPGKFWIILWCTVWSLAALLWLLSRSPFGTVLRAIAENEERMRFSAFNTFLPRLAAFVLAGGLAAIAGILQVLHSGFVSPEMLGLATSTNALVAALTGGVAGTMGPLLGGLLFTIAQDEFGALGVSQLFTGVAIVVVIVLFPNGMAGAFGSARAALALPFKSAAGRQ
jgi:branched-chain amino acid transport system permease protein